MKTIPDKIEWNGYKQQLIELFDVLFIKEYIPYEQDKFVSHFVNRNNIPYKYDKKKRGLIDWEKPPYLLFILIDYLVEKNFILHYNSESRIKVIKKHFKNVNVNTIRQIYFDNKNSYESFKFRKLLKTLLPNPTGEITDKLKKYITPQSVTNNNKLYYKERNKRTVYAVLVKLNIDIKPLTDIELLHSKFILLQNPQK